MEKKYVLAKDTPTAKKGTVIERLGSTLYVRENNCLYNVSLSGESLECEISRLLHEGWIEEVKPLEIWVNLYSEDKYPGIYGNMHDSLENAVQYRDSSCIPFIRTVHFIEAPEGESK
ncbi:MAG TPA: hypothetical protein VMV32_08275 [Ignavibacteriaceae bacterium]|nr:hypothetical protein [Ignavibacteriaceae bacterium]